MTISQATFNDMTSTFKDAGRLDLVAELTKAFKPKAVLTSKEAAQLLGVSSPNTVKNWLAGGYFPGAYQTAGGHWRFPHTDVLAAKQRLESLREKNSRGDLTPDDCDDAPAPPLL